MYVQYMTEVELVRSGWMKDYICEIMNHLEVKCNSKLSFEGYLYDLRETIQAVKVGDQASVNIVI